jgi:hypothetical protein
MYFSLKQNVYMSLRTDEELMISLTVMGKTLVLQSRTC